MESPEVHETSGERGETPPDASPPASPHVADERGPARAETPREPSPAESGGDVEEQADEFPAAPAADADPLPSEAMRISVFMFGC